MNSWQNAYKESAKNLADLFDFFKDSKEHLEALPKSFQEKDYPIFIPQFFLKKIKEQPVSSALWKQFIPDSKEFTGTGLIDPIGDQIHQKTSQLIHRYHNRALFLPLNICPINCRYCFRKNELYGEKQVFKNDLDATLGYLNNHPEIDEIIFTGGDPLILSNDKIAAYLDDLAKISSIKFIRFHTRTPVIIPSRIDDGFLEIITSYSSRFQMNLMIHINHHMEFSPEFEQIIKKLKKVTTLFSQSVLLKGVNDDLESLVKLFKSLALLGVIPYYLHHPDQALGAEHFYLNTEDGAQIYTKLRNYLSGWMLPEYVIEAPNGQGKAPVVSQLFYDKDGQSIVIDNHIHSI